MKIHIIGCSGSGKSYLANFFSNKYHIPHFDLDDIQWDNHYDNYGIKMEEGKRNGLLKDILQNESWIIKGVYYEWVQQSFEEAEIIYVLDLPKLRYKYRIIRRFIRRKIGMEKGKKETLHTLCSLLKWTNTFQKNNLIEIKTILSKYEDKVIWISKYKEIKNLLMK